MKVKRVTQKFRNVIEVEEYLDGRYGAPGEKRKEKKKATPEEMEQVNQWNREKKARWRLREYFDVNDYLFTLTYSRNARPPDMVAAKAQFKEFYTCAKKEYKKRGYELRWLRNIECTPTGNWHVHVILNRIPDTDIIIEDAWRHGKVKDKQLLYAEGEFRKLAQYITKNPRTQEKYVEEGILDHKITESSFSASRNMPLPEPEIDHIKKWQKEPRPKRGWYIEKESYFEGINKVTGYPYRHYTMIRIERIRRDERSTHIHRNRRRKRKRVS